MALGLGPPAPQPFRLLGRRRRPRSLPLGLVAANRPADGLVQVPDRLLDRREAPPVVLEYRQHPRQQLIVRHGPPLRDTLGQAASGLTGSPSITAAPAVRRSRAARRRPSPACTCCRPAPPRR